MTTYAGIRHSDEERSKIQKVGIWSMQDLTPHVPFGPRAVRTRLLGFLRTTHNKEPSDQRTCVGPPSWVLVVSFFPRK